jgi:hypothetical protein
MSSDLKYKHYEPGTDERRLQDAFKEEERKNEKFRRVLSDVFEAVENTVLFLRVVLYGGSVAGAWFYLENKVLAVAVAASLTCAHLLMIFLSYVRRKKKELTQ